MLVRLVNISSLFLLCVGSVGSDQMNDNSYKQIAKKKYNSQRWQTIRQLLILKNNNICKCCKRVFNSDKLIIHHIIKVDQTNVNDDQFFYNCDNLIVVCTYCHNNIHKNNKSVRNVIIDEHGNVRKVLE